MKNKKWFLMITALLLILLAIPFFTVGAEEEEAEKITIETNSYGQVFELNNYSPNKADSDKYVTSVKLKFKNEDGYDFVIEKPSQYDWFLTIAGNGKEKRLNICPYRMSGSFDYTYYFDICIGEEDNIFIPEPGQLYTFKVEIYKDDTLCYYSDFSESTLNFYCNILPALPGVPPRGGDDDLILIPSQTPWVNMNEEGTRGTALQVLVFNGGGTAQSLRHGSPEVKVTISKTDGTGQPYTTTTKFFSAIQTTCHLMIVDENFIPEKGCDYTVALELTYTIPSANPSNDPYTEVYKSEPTPGFYLAEDHELILRTDPQALYLTVTAPENRFEYVSAENGTAIRFSLDIKDYKGQPYIADPSRKWQVNITEQGTHLATIAEELCPISIENGRYVFELPPELTARIQNGKTYSVYVSVYDEEAQNHRNQLEDVYFASAPAETTDPGDNLPSDTDKPSDTTDKKGEQKKGEKSSLLPIVAITAVALISVAGAVVFFAKKKKKQ